MAKTKFCAQFWPRKSFLWVLPLLVRDRSKLLSYVISRKANEPNLRKGEKLNFGIDFGPFSPNPPPPPPPYFFLWILPQLVLWLLPLLVVRCCSKLSLFQFKRKLMNKTWENGKKQFRDWFWPVCPKFRSPDFFLYLCRF